VIYEICQHYYGEEGGYCYSSTIAGHRDGKPYCSWHIKSFSAPHAKLDWSEREAVVAYLLYIERKYDAATYGDMHQLAIAWIARGDHMTAAREGRLDHLRERVRGMVK
jgi:hypothetical protein